MQEYTRNGKRSQENSNDGMESASNSSVVTDQNQKKAKNSPSILNETKNKSCDPSNNTSNSSSMPSYNTQKPEHDVPHQEGSGQPAALPPSTGNPLQDEALHSLLMSWYYSGYATGRYQAMVEMGAFHSDGDNNEGQFPADSSSVEKCNADPQLPR